MTDTDDQMAARIEAVRQRVKAGRSDPSFVAPVDPYDIREVSRDKMAGRDRDVDRWRQVMDRNAFRWLTPEQLNRVVGPLRIIPQQLDGLLDAYGRPVQNSSLYVDRPHQVGQWRRDRPHPIPLAFTAQDLVELFGDSPERFAGWLGDHERVIRARRAGVVVGR